MKIFHGCEGGFGMNNDGSVLKKCILFKIIDTINQLHDSDIILRNVIHRNIGNEEITTFWRDMWLGENSLMTTFPRLFLLETGTNCIVNH